MFESLLPDLYLASLTDLDLLQLRKEGKRGLIIDLDNTLVNWGETELTSEIKEWMKKARELDFAICIVSNGSRRRVDIVAKDLDIPAIPLATKPRRRAFRKARELIGTSKAETVVIGDQLFTDVLGGKRLGLYTVLVSPSSKREFVTTKIMRLLERIVFWFWDR